MVDHAIIRNIEKIYDDLLVLENEDGYPEIGFKSLDVALKFVHMVRTYALELQGNRDKFVTEYIAMIVKKSDFSRVVYGRRFVYYERRGYSRYVGFFFRQLECF